MSSSRSGLREGVSTATAAGTVRDHLHQPANLLQSVESSARREVRSTLLDEDDRPRLASITQPAQIEPGSMRDRIRDQWGV
jgi:hypothetical protein